MVRNHYSCEICEFGFLSLLGSMEAYAGEKPYSCDTCKGTFAKVMSTAPCANTLDKWFSCKVCRLVFGKKKIQFWTWRENFFLKHVKHPFEILYIWNILYNIFNNISGWAFLKNMSIKVSWSVRICIFIEICIESIMAKHTRENIMYINFMEVSQ